MKYKLYMKEMYGITKQELRKRREWKPLNVVTKPKVSVKEKLEKSLATSAVKNLIDDIFGEAS